MVGGIPIKEKVIKAKHLILFLIFYTISPFTQAGFLLQWSFLYNTILPITASPEVDTYTYSRMHNSIFVGASVGQSAKFHLGPTYHLWNKSYKASSSATEKTISLTDFGACVVYFFDMAKRWKLELAYYPKVSGTRTNTDNTEENITGSGFKAGFGYRRRVTRYLTFGFTLFYQSSSIESKIISSTETKLTDSYSGIVPMFEFSLGSK